jgi:histidine triad (HIT) family protein
MSKTCVFCEKFNKRPEGDHLVFEPLNPVVEGHLLVIHREHTDDFTENPIISGQLTERASLVAKIKGGDYNLITSKGKNATQTVPHLHIHLIPRKENDGLLLPWSGQAYKDQLVREIEEMEDSGLRNENGEWVESDNISKSKVISMIRESKGGKDGKKNNR